MFSSEKVDDYLQQVFSYLQEEKIYTYHQPLSLQHLQVQKFTSKPFYFTTEFLFISF